MSTATDDKRRPLNININGREVVSSTEQYTVDEAADIQRMLVAAFNWVGGGREEYRVNPGALQIVKDVRR